MAATRRGKKSCRGGLLFVTGFALGLAVAAAVWYRYLSPEALQAQGETAQEQSGLPPEPRVEYDFYTVLPEREVVVPEVEVTEDKSPVRPAETSESKDRTAYMLQIGSFSKMEQADRRKASLALLGIEAEIQKVSINNKETYHRVRSGPYYGVDSLNAARSLLKNNGINAIVIKLKP